MRGYAYFLGPSRDRQGAAIESEFSPVRLDWLESFFDWVTAQQPHVERVWRDLKMGGPLHHGQLETVMFQQATRAVVFVVLLHLTKLTTRGISVNNNFVPCGTIRKQSGGEQLIPIWIRPNSTHFQVVEAHVAVTSEFDQRHPGRIVVLAEVNFEHFGQVVQHVI